MSDENQPVAVVAGAGPGLGLALCQCFLEAGYRVAATSRSGNIPGDLGPGFLPLACDLTEPDQVDRAIGSVEQALGTPSVYIHNAAGFLHRDFLSTSADEFRALWETTCLGAVNGAQRVLGGMLKAGSGTLLFSGATASVRASGQFSAFGSAKFALRGLAQSLARELGPSGIHVAHVVIDGVIWGPKARDFGMRQGQCLEPMDIARSYLHLAQQGRSAWTQELDIRPDVEKF